jgi:hypothetical protein
MRIKDVLIICFVIVALYGILVFDFYLPVVIVSVLGIVPVYFIFQKTLKKTVQKEYVLSDYTYDLKTLGIAICCIIAVFVYLFVQESMSFTEGVSVALTVIIYILLYIDFLRKKIDSHRKSNYPHESFNKASIALLLYLLYSVLYFG